MTNQIEYNPRPNSINCGLMETTILKQPGDFFIVECETEQIAMQRRKGFLFSHSRIKKRKTNPASFDIMTTIIDKTKVKVTRK